MAKYRVNLLVEADDDATIEQVADFITALEWVGGGRHPNDPMFDSLKILSGEVKIGRIGRKNAAT